ncbi:MAG: glutaminase A [Miltoncostaeaceae bacterium]
MGSLIQDIVAGVHERYLGDRSGDILRSIPAMEDVDPDRFGLCLATADGHVYEAGDTAHPFCIQSICKPFTYGLALADRGMEAVDAKIDVEPSGEQYNRISLDDDTHRPRNAMINAGALVAASLVAGDTPAEQAARIHEVLSRCAGHELDVDEEVFRSEIEVGHRNRAIAHMLREFEMIEDDPNLAHEVYLRACATTATCRDLGLMGATLANGGVNPHTGTRVFTAALTERVLSVMATCGMYDSAGEWLADVGMAAKSGVGGGIVAVLPGQLAIAAFSPRLDDHGNSVRAFRSCRRLSSDLELHAFHVARGSRSAIRAAYDIVEAPSALRRPESDCQLIERYGRRTRVYELHGDLLFAGAESAVREMSAAAEEGLDFLIADVRRVIEVADISRELLGRLREFLRSRGCEAFLVDPEGVISTGPRSDDGRPVVFERLGEAIAFVEDEVLRLHGDGAGGGARADLADHPGLVGVDPALIERLREHLVARTIVDGDVLARQGDDQAGAFFLCSGRVRASLELPEGSRALVARFTPGATIAGAYLVTGNEHPLTLAAEGRVEALELTRQGWRQLAEDPELHAALLTMFMHAFYEEAERARTLVSRRRLSMR